MKRRRKRADDELNFWQPASDMFSALLLVFLLVILLLGLYLVHIPDNTQIDPFYGDAEGGAWDGDGDPTPTAFLWVDAGGDGGGGGGEPASPVPTLDVSPTVSPSPPPTVTPTPDLPGAGGGAGGGEGGGNGGGEGRGDTPDEGLKAAVYVMLVDAETDRTIKEADVEFELYESDGALQILNTYYPERLTFRSYRTTESGTFYFPEKLQQGVYELHELTEPEGYDAADNQTFVLHQLYDWPDPYVVRVPVYPSRNILRVKMLDAETGLAVTGGSFDVVAAENIITSDGTLRYRAGQIAGEIVCDETGYGESDELYLGSYTLCQRDIPPYYASLLEDVSVSVEKKTRVEPPLNTLVCDRTKVLVTLSDELYATRPIEGATYVLRAEDGRSMPVAFTTNARGTFLLNELEKATVYRLSETASVGDYRLNRTDSAFTVSPDGRIDGETQLELTLTNRTLRVAIGVTDAFSSVQVPNVSLALYNLSDELIRTWTTAGTPLVFTELAEGRYYLIKDGDTEKRYEIAVRDLAEVQTINIHTRYALPYVVIGASAAAVILAVLLAARAVRKRRKTNRKATG